MFINFKFKKIRIIILSIFLLSLFYPFTSIKSQTATPDAFASGNLKQDLGSSLNNSTMKPGELEILIKKPAPRISIPGLKFSDPNLKELIVEDDLGKKYISIPFLAEYIAGLYKYAVAASGILSLLMIIVGGFQWAFSAGNRENISSAQKRIAGAIVGLTIAVVSYTILNIVNPELVNFRKLKVLYIPGESISEYEEEGLVALGPAISISGGFPVSGGLNTSGKICDSRANCTQYCTSDGKAKADMVLQTQNKLGIKLPTNLVDPTIFIQKIFQDNGCQPTGGKATTASVNCGVYWRGISPMLLPEVVVGVAKAASIAKSKGYVLSVGSTYRTPLMQMGKVCVHIANAKEKAANAKPCQNSKNKAETGGGNGLACPGGSPHMNGYAIDLSLVKADALNKNLTAPTGHVDSCQANEAWIKGSSPLVIKGKTYYPEHERILNDIMFAAGWWKYCEELWHFEYTANGGSLRRKTY